MTKDAKIEYSVLNVAASPHPQGIYFELFKKAALNPVRFWGDQFAAISTPRRTKEGYFHGRLVVWTQIDPNEPAVDKDRLAEVDLPETDFSVPDNIGFNTRTFLYAFREKDHKLFIESHTELRKRLSPGRSKKIFGLLFDAPILEVDDPVVEITVIPTDDALEKIFGIPKLKRLRIHLLRPNADDEDVQEILEELEEQGAKSQDVSFVASTLDGRIVPNERTRKQAEVAQHNGHVEGYGQEGGERVDYSTKEYPRTISKPVSEIGTAVSGILRVAAETIIRNTGR